MSDATRFATTFLEGLEDATPKELLLFLTASPELLGLVVERLEQRTGDRS